MIDYFDYQSSLDPPPAYISENWGFKTPEWEKIWANYFEMRKDFTESVTVLANAYNEGESLGIALGAVAIAVLGIMAAGGVGVMYFLKGTTEAVARGKEADVRKEEAITRRMTVNQDLVKALIPYLPPGTDPVKFVKDLFAQVQKVGRDHGYTVPDVLAKGFNILKGVLVAGAVYGVYRIVKDYTNE